ncbi:Cytochrome oxidase assembly, partial [Conoideocrella luteorostrata]
MPAFQSNKFRGSGEASKVGSQYRRLMSKHPFVMFGLPFLAVVVAGSFVLTPAAAIRYERHDRKVRQMTKEAELGVRRGARKVDMKEEYYVSLSPNSVIFWRFGDVGDGISIYECCHDTKS